MPWSLISYNSPSLPPPFSVLIRLHSSHVVHPPPRAQGAFPILVGRRRRRARRSFVTQSISEPRLLRRDHINSNAYRVKASCRAADGAEAGRRGEGQHGGAQDGQASRNARGSQISTQEAAAAADPAVH